MLTVKNVRGTLIYYDGDKQIKNPKEEIKMVRVAWPNGVVEDYETVWQTVNGEHRLTIRETLFGLPFQPPLWEYLPYVQVEVIR